MAVKKFGCNMSTNNEPKFKVGDIVLAKHADGKVYEFVVNAIDSIISRENQYRCYLINDTHKLIYVFAESSLSGLGGSIISKPKWSVGTYVEFLEDVLPCYIKGEIQLIREKTSHSLILDDGNAYDLYRFDMLEKRNKIKWHENIPERKELSSIEFIKNFEGLKIRNPLVEAPQNNDALDAMKSSLPKPYEIRNELYERYGKTFLEEIYEDRCKYNGINRILDKFNSKYTGAVDPYEKEKYKYDNISQGSWYTMIGKNFVFPHDTGNRLLKELLKQHPLTIDECYNKLDKPEITISKQKQVTINIDKPKL